MVQPTNASESPATVGPEDDFLAKILRRAYTRRQVLVAAGLTALAGCSVSQSPSPSAGPSASTGPSVEPSSDVINPGKLTVLVPEFATERFDGAYAAGETGEQFYGKIANGFVIASD